MGSTVSSAPRALADRAMFGHECGFGQRRERGRKFWGEGSDARRPAWLEKLLFWLQEPPSGAQILKNSAAPVDRPSYCRPVKTRFPSFNLPVRPGRPDLEPSLKSLWVL